MDEPMGVDSDTTEELPGLKTPQKAPCSLLWKQPLVEYQACFLARRVLRLKLSFNVLVEFCNFFVDW